MSPRSFYPFISEDEKLFTIDYQYNGHQTRFFFPALNHEEARKRFTAMKQSGQVNPDTIEEIYPCDDAHTSSKTD